MARAKTPPDGSKPVDQNGKGSPPGDRSKLVPGLYLVATPIGNLGDISLRARTVLAQADAIACEDTRTTAKLLTLLGLPFNTLIACHDHNEARAALGLIERIKNGQSVALVSDAGAPLISDPGYGLVDLARANGLMVTAVPGPSAVIAALQLSGLPSDRFLFAGFPPAKTTARKQTLRELAQVPSTLIFFESPNRLAASLADMAAVLGVRMAAVVRELTKLYEETVRGTLPDLAQRYRSHPVKGEIVVVVAPPAGQAADDADDLDVRIKAALARGLGVRDAAALVAAETGHPRRLVYARALLAAQS